MRNSYFNFTFLIKVFLSTDTQLDSAKNNFKFALKLTLKGFYMFRCEKHSGTGRNQIQSDCDQCHTHHTHIDQTHHTHTQHTAHTHTTTHTTHTHTTRTHVCYKSQAGYI